MFYARRDAGARGATVSGYDGTVGFDWYTNELTRVRHHHPFTATERACLAARESADTGTFVDVRQVGRGCA